MLVKSPPPDPLILLVRKPLLSPSLPPTTPHIYLLMDMWHAWLRVSAAAEHEEAVMFQFGLKINSMLIVVSGGRAVLMMGGGDK